MNKIHIKTRKNAQSIMPFAAIALGTVGALKAYCLFKSGAVKPRFSMTSLFIGSGILGLGTAICGLFSPMEIDKIKRIPEFQILPAQLPGNVVLLRPKTK